MQYQSVLVAVGEAVHQEYAQLEEKRRGLEADKQDITEVETRLDWFRADLTRQYKQQQRWNQVDGGQRTAPPPSSPGPLSPRRVGGNAGNLSPRRGDDDDGLGYTAGGGLDQREVGQLQQLQEEVDKRRRWLRDLEEVAGDDDYRRNAGTGESSPGRPVRLAPGRQDVSALPPPAPPPMVPPLVASAPPRYGFGLALARWCSERTFDNTTTTSTTTSPR